MPVEVHVYVDEELGERLRRAMFEHHLTKTAIVREALRRELGRLDAVARKTKVGRREGRR